MWRFMRLLVAAGRSRLSLVTRAGIATRSASTCRAQGLSVALARVALSRSATTLAARFAEDAHVDGTVLFREVVGLGFDRSYVTFVRELRRLALRPRREACQIGGHGVTTVIAHEPGEEIQWDWLELTQTPWGEPAHVLVGVLAFSGKCRVAICEGESFPHLAEAIDGVLRRLGGSTRAWRTDRMATVVHPGTDRITGQFAQLAKHYGVQVWVCPARRPQRKGVVEGAVKYITRSWWRTAPVSSLGQVQADPDRWVLAVSDQRKRRDATIAELAAQEPARLASCRVPGRFGGPACRLSHGDGRLRGQPLQRAARHRWTGRDSPGAAGGAAPGDHLAGEQGAWQGTGVRRPAPGRCCRARSTRGSCRLRCSTRSRPQGLAGQSRTGHQEKPRCEPLAPCAAPRRIPAW
jgi:transposase